jgi:dTDP-4-dehydrorhamnose reductase
LTQPQRFLITGAAGLLAPFIAEAVSKTGRVILTARNSGDFSCDLTDEHATSKLLNDTHPDVVIHCAAITNVDECELNPSVADLGNRLTGENLARNLPSKSQLIYISSDQVYPDVPGPHIEGSESPVNEYGRSKLAGETAILSHPGGLALRTSFFGASRSPGRNSLSDFIAESLQARRNISLFEDVLFSPLHATTLAALTSEIVDRRLTGVYNMASRDGMSKADFAYQIADHLGLQTETATRGNSSAIPKRAPRISDLRLNPARLENILGRKMPTLQKEIEKL